MVLLACRGLLEEEVLLGVIVLISAGAHCDGVDGAKSIEQNACMVASLLWYRMETISFGLNVYQRSDPVLHDLGTALPSAVCKEAYT